MRQSQQFSDVVDMLKLELDPVMTMDMYLIYRNGEDPDVSTMSNSKKRSVIPSSSIQRSIWNVQIWFATLSI